MILYQYRVWCSTESAWKYTDYRASIPTTCPDNSGHSIDTSQTVIIGSEGGDNPHAEDLKPYVSPDMFPLGYFLQHQGEGDDVANNAVGGGTKMKAVRSSEGTTTVDIQFVRHILLAGGSIRRTGALVDDEISMTVRAPATTGTSNPGGGAYDKYQVATGVNMFIPNATVEGDWDLNLTETLNANVTFTKAVPVPSSKDANGEYTGFFDYDVNADSLTFNATQKGAFNLFDVALDITKHVIAEPLLGDGDIDMVVPAVKPALCLPHWQFRSTVYHGSGSHDLNVRWKFLSGVKRTI